MRRQRMACGILVLIAATVLQAAEPTTSRPAQVGAMAALQQAAEAGKYLFLLVCDKDDEPTRTARQAVETAVGKMDGKARWVTVRRDAPEEKAVVQKFGLKNAPTPLVLAIAPNGAITGGILPQDIDEAAVLDAVATPCGQTCLKALQDRKVVLLCVQNKATKSNDAAMKGVNDFKADAQYASFTEIVRLDPADAAEGKFLKQLQVDAEGPEAVTVLLAPPSAIVGTFKGATEKATLVSTVQKAACGGGGCGSGGCAPGQSCPAPATQSAAK